jgi:hypothetical protein
LSEGEEEDADEDEVGVAEEEEEDEVGEEEEDEAEDSDRTTRCRNRRDVPPRWNIRSIAIALRFVVGDPTTISVKAFCLSSNRGRGQRLLV